MSIRQFLPVLLIALLAYQAVVPCCSCIPLKTTSLIGATDSFTVPCSFHCCHHVHSQTGVKSGTRDGETPEAPHCPFCDDIADVHVYSREHIPLHSTDCDAHSRNVIDGVAPQIRMTRNNECRCLHRLVRGPLGVRLQV